MKEVFDVVTGMLCLLAFVYAAWMFTEVALGHPTLEDIADKKTIFALIVIGATLITGFVGTVQYFGAWGIFWSIVIYAGWMFIVQKIKKAGDFI